MASRYEEFAKFRQRMNETILEQDNRVIKRMFSLDNLAYREGTRLPVSTKEMLGLVASLVLRCDDCVSYHISKCLEAGISRDELFEAMSVGLVVGGTIVIPHLRRAVEFMDELLEAEQSAAG
ncbi:MAG: carboxymuconolactone decarboxylase family protein [Gammaproteobacteria bacterium]|jgi:AhpD family alkylhydroperoxidase